MASRTLLSAFKEKENPEMASGSWKGNGFSPPRCPLLHPRQNFPVNAQAWLLPVPLAFSNLQQQEQELPAEAWLLLGCGEPEGRHVRGLPSDLWLCERGQVED